MWRATLAFIFLAFAASLAAAPASASHVCGHRVACPPTGDIAMAPDSSWALAFRDEFNDSSLDTVKWETHYACGRQVLMECTADFPQSRSGERLYSDWLNGEAQWYRPGNVTEGNGYLMLTAKREDTVSFTSGRLFNYTSGMVQSKPSFSFREGFMEARVQLPTGFGLWPAFWTWPENEQWPPEIDAFEFFGSHPTFLYLGYHDQERGSSSKAISATDWRIGWHTIAVHWERRKLTWYIDGVARRVVHDDPALSMYMLATLAVCNGQKCPAPNSTTILPASLKMDYVRVWKRR
jgi:beta-glucanase (GH16 family)